MVKLIWTNQAIYDLNTIGDYIAESLANYALITVQKLFEKPTILKTFPIAGRIVPEKNQTDLRELIEGNYRIIYQLSSNDTIHILTIYHSSRDLKI
ncbi:MAG: type II toxin-antitoxin system RelE/ParE family toxin [Sphingobacteriaceae bacterium]